METEKLNPNQFKCAICNNIYTKDVSEDEALKELRELFGEHFTPEDCEVVCDDCFNRHIKPQLN